MLRPTDVTCLPSYLCTSGGNSSPGSRDLRHTVVHGHQGCSPAGQVGVPHLLCCMWLLALVSYWWMSERLTLDYCRSRLNITRFGALLLELGVLNTQKHFFGPGIWYGSALQFLELVYIYGKKSEIAVLTSLASLVILLYLIIKNKCVVISGSE